MAKKTNTQPAATAANTGENEVLTPAPSAPLHNDLIDAADLPDGMELIDFEATHQSIPHPVKAYQWDGEFTDKVIPYPFNDTPGVPMNTPVLDTGITYTQVNKGDYIVQHPNGRYEVFREEVFPYVYEPIQTTAD